MAAFRSRPIAGSDARSLAVSVVRYTPQAVLIANVEEARYRAIASEDGRLLVEARYAVRNNQRAFLKVVLPAGATVWSAAVAGRPIRPGRAEQDGVLLPLEKCGAGQDAPTFVVELVYLQRIAEWAGKGRTTLALPALGRPATLRLGRPWLEQSVALTLAAPTDAAVPPLYVAAKLARGLARSVRAMDERNGEAVPDLSVDEVTPAGALVVDHDRIVVRAERAGQVVKAKVAALGFEPVDLEFAADAPRDRDLPLKAKAAEKK